MARFYTAEILNENVVVPFHFLRRFSAANGPGHVLPPVRSVPIEPGQCLLEQLVFLGRPWTGPLWTHRTWSHSSTQLINDQTQTLFSFFFYRKYIINQKWVWDVGWWIKLDMRGFLFIERGLVWVGWGGGNLNLNKVWFQIKIL